MSRASVAQVTPTMYVHVTFVEVAEIATSADWANKDVKDASGHAVGQVRATNSFYGQWGGKWGMRANTTYKAMDKAILNAQFSCDGTDSFAVTANVAYELVPGFTITPEISYTQWRDKKSVLNGKDAWQGLLLLQRTF